MNKERMQPYTVNLSPLFLDKSVSESPASSLFRSTVLGYPPSAVLELENFNGLVHEKQVTSALKDTAFTSGTVLFVESLMEIKKVRTLYT
jgi:hypothetical protein